MVVGPSPFFTVVPMKASIYLDNNSTTPLDPLVLEGMIECYHQGYLNPASQHRAGQTARRRLEEIRSALLGFLNAETRGMVRDSLLFTSGGTESNNLALIGLTQAAAQQVKLSQGITDPAAQGQVLISAIEHPSIVGAAEQLARLGFPVRRIPVTPAGVCCLMSLQDLLQQPTLLVSMMLANNETGVLQPVAEAAALARAAGALFHTDAVQVVGKLPVDFRQLGADALSFTAHKFHGPRGIGGLVLKSGVSIQPILFGGFQQQGLRPGTEDLVLPRGMELALESAVWNPSRYQAVQQLRDHFQARLVTDIPESVVIGAQSPRLPTTLNIAFPGTNRQALLLAADRAGVAISTGSACASGSSEPSPVLLAMGLPAEVVDSAVRISLGVFNTQSEIDSAADTFVRIIQQIKQQV